MKNERSIYWTMLLYKESEDYNTEEIIKKVKSNYNAIWILHNKDKYLEDEYNEDGTTKHKKGDLKKPHYHIVLKFKNYKWVSALSEELGIEIKWFQKISSLESILCYLIHYKEEEKHHYLLEEVIGSRELKNKLNKTIENIDKTEEDKIIDIVNYIRLEKHIISFGKMLDYVLRKGLYSEYRRSYAIISKLIEEHNNFIIDNLH